MSALLVTGLGVITPGEGRPFDVSAALPGRGYRRLPPAAQYLLAAAASAVADGSSFVAAPAHRRGVVVGENNAAAALMEAQDRTIIEAHAADLPPLTTPYFAASLFGSRLAAEYDAHAFSLTVNSPRTAGVESLGHAARALAGGRAEVVLIGATEHTLPAGEPGAADSDAGAVVLVGEPVGAGRTGLGVVDVRTGSVDGFDRLWAAAVPDDDIAVVETVLDDSPAGKHVEHLLAARCRDLRTLPAPAGCLTPLRRVAHGLCAASPDRLVVTAAAEGGLAITRITPPSTESPC
ncbi:beta-ketoacyl synthase N-terminal-like domain-containing protein [Mangrovihabitans endophyticus]|uniref:Beta-ketoacyl synthase-like N-terminal domain-containing protein n=1 Tax=Mangrovihabitans endophyticus TaxID=1751298 RepID=A0A8J3BWH2_9ACTN|nr:beta-ketoacyl synthase N-terminal-like domain-containing protein [Mangrovihabitans endophyticus]GGK75928.1 hypothetical protein GCM10012284_07420 [Mangrovihabitans endophyticus]